MSRKPNDDSDPLEPTLPAEQQEGRSSSESDRENHQEKQKPSNPIAKQQELPLGETDHENDEKKNQRQNSGSISEAGQVSEITHPKPAMTGMTASNVPSSVEELIEAAKRYAEEERTREGKEQEERDSVLSAAEASVGEFTSRTPEEEVLYGEEEISDSESRHGGEINGEEIDEEDLEGIPGEQMIRTPRRHAEFRAELFSLTPMDIIQLICNQRVSAKLRVQDLGGNLGYIFIRRGLIVHGDTGGLEGVAALGCMLSWPGGEIVEERPWTEPDRETITTYWETTLMEAAQLADEFAAGVPSAFITELFTKSI